jgi:HAD superfamily hydrolase (TIGR01509 family)
VVFDLDGTLTDNMGLHADAFGIFVGRHGLPPLDSALRARLDGKRNRDIFPILFGRALPEADLNAYADEKEALYREFSRGRLRPLPGLVTFLDRLAARGLPVAIATSAPAANVIHNLAELGLAARFEHIVRADEVPQGKPHPDVFLEAARRMGVSPRACWAFEDAPMGVQAARAAGMVCIGITTSFDAQALAAHGAAIDGAVADYTTFLAGRDGVWFATSAANGPRPA